MTKRDGVSRSSKAQKAFEDRMTYKPGDLIIEFDPKTAKADEGRDEGARDESRVPKPT